MTHDFRAYDLQENKSLQVLFHVFLQLEVQTQRHASLNIIDQSEVQKRIMYMNIFQAYSLVYENQRFVNATYDMHIIRYL